MPKSLDRGLYETLVTARLDERLKTLSDQLNSCRTDLHKAEAADRLALHIGRVVERAITSIALDSRSRRGLEVIGALLSLLDELVDGVGALDDVPVINESVLRSILGTLPDGSVEAVETPLIPLLDTTLLTNAPGEPRVGRQLLAEIASADRIDVLMAFIRNSGINPLRERLRRHCDNGRRIRVLTTTYTGSTEQRALDVLAELGAEVRVSYDTSTTRLHAKAWLFHRKSGFSTVYVGSSNLTHSAQVAGLEWNVRVSGARNPDVVDKVSAVFDSYWESSDFRDYDTAEFKERTETSGGPRPLIYLSPVEIRPWPFQERLLEQIAVSRHRGHHRNLLAAATGTGKTVMAALDYVRLAKSLPRSRLLFVAHRKEILEQSRATFCHALRDASFGELWVDGKKPKHFEHVFASVQSLNHVELENLAPNHFDVVIVDEFHHAAAASYTRLLDHLEPVELLGLTATPERSDGLPILSWFGDRIAAELRLWDAIDQNYLSPFLYFGVHDGLDLSEVPWKRGRGYDVEELTKVYTSTDAWAGRVIAQVRDRAENLDELRALGFCVSVDHARYMSRKFYKAGIVSTAVWADTSSAERSEALRKLSSGELKVVFSVDLFNEGVDVPEVNTLLLLRPTDSPVLFLQQLGRGLRSADGKAVCTVLDFVGHHRREFRLDRRFRALLGGTRTDLEKHVKGGFPYLPAGCHMELDRVASEIVLRSIRNSVPSNWRDKANELRDMTQGGKQVGLGEFLYESGLELEDVYAGNKSWSDLCESAGLAVAGEGPKEKILRRAVGRLLHVDDKTRLDSYLGLIRPELPPSVGQMNRREKRVARMLVSQLLDQAVDKATGLQAGLDLLWKHPKVLAELCQLLKVLGDVDGRVTHLHEPLSKRPAVPLQVHAKYTRLEILAAFGVGSGAKVGAWQTGVRWVEEAEADLFAFTLDKTEGHFSPTTRYRDYAISRDLIHWESQSTTRADGKTGLRYQAHLARGSEVFLFARLKQSDRAFWFLGPATYVEHSGERPMAIVWRLQHPLPGDLYASFAAAVA